MKLKKITARNQHNFFNDLGVGEVFNYAKRYEPQELIELAEQYDLIIEYCNPETTEYREHGAFTMKVVGTIGEEYVEPTLTPEEKFMGIIKDSGWIVKFLGTKSKKYILLKHGIDTFEKLENEYNLIQDKKSNLPSNARKNLVAVYESVTAPDVEEPEMGDKQKKIKELQDRKLALLDEHGVFGGGDEVQQEHLSINKQLEALGVDPNS